MDIAGVMILIGVGMAAFRRYVLRPKTLEFKLGRWVCPRYVDLDRAGRLHQ